jgi:hypothetical protein
MNRYRCTVPNANEVGEVVMVLSLADGRDTSMSKAIDGFRFSFLKTHKMQIKDEVREYNCVKAFHIQTPDCRNARLYLSPCRRFSGSSRRPRMFSWTRFVVTFCLLSSSYTSRVTVLRLWQVVTSTDRRRARGRVVRDRGRVLDVLWKTGGGCWTCCERPGEGVGRVVRDRGRMLDVLWETGGVSIVSASLFHEETKNVLDAWRKSLWM